LSAAADDLQEQINKEQINKSTKNKSTNQQINPSTNPQINPEQINKQQNKPIFAIVNIIATNRLLIINV
jgi:hypothetical protein